MRVNVTIVVNAIIKPIHDEALITPPAPKLPPLVIWEPLCFRSNSIRSITRLQVRMFFRKFKPFSNEQRVVSSTQTRSKICIFTHRNTIHKGSKHLPTRPVDDGPSWNKVEDALFRLIASIFSIQEQPTNNIDRTNLYMALEETPEDRYIIIWCSMITECESNGTEIRSEQTTSKVNHRFEALMIKKIYPKFLK